MKDKKLTDQERVNNLVKVNSNLIEENHGRIDYTNNIVGQTTLDVAKLQQSYFTAGNGIVITDNRPYGMDNIDISVDPTLLSQPRLDSLEHQILELQETNKILAKYIFDSQK